MDTGLQNFDFDPSIFDRTVTGTNQQRIVGGVEVKPKGKYPFLCAMSIKDDVSCGGTLLSNKWYLTAAHCVEDPPSAFKIYCNVHNVWDIGKDNKIVGYNVKKIHVHSGWNKKVMHNDIALFELDSPAPEVPEPSVYLDCSNEAYEEDDGETLFNISGWGATSYDGDASSVLMEVQVPPYDVAACKANYRANRVNITTTQICAGYPEGNKDGCLGDSGGPMFTKDKAKSKGGLGRYKQVGVVSFGIRCAEGKYPGIYTKVNKYINWIKKITGRDWCTPAN